MESLDDEARVFKLVGPVLVRQEVDEARANVQSRMDLLKRQVCVWGHGGRRWARPRPR